MLDVVAEQRPAGARAALVGQPDAARVDEPRRARRRPVELDVRVPADDDVRVDARERRADGLVRRDPREDLLVVRRRRVAEDDARRGRRARARPSAASRRRARASRRRGARRTTGRASLSGREDVALAVAAEEASRRPSRSRSTHSTWNGPQRTSPPTTISSTSAAVDVREHRLERGQVPVDVVERGDPHGATRLATCRSTRSVVVGLERQLVRNAPSTAPRAPVRRRRGRAPDSPSRRRRSASDGSRPRGSARSRRRARAPGPRRRAWENDAETTSPAPRGTGTATSTSLGAGAEARKRVDDALGPVLGVDDLGRVRRSPRTFVL